MWRLLRWAAFHFSPLRAIGAVNTLFWCCQHTGGHLLRGAAYFYYGHTICYYAAKYGLDIDLLTRGAGFGYLALPSPH